MPVADALEAPAVRDDGAEPLGDLGQFERGGDPLREVSAAAPEAIARLDEVVEERAHVDLGEGIAELTEGARSMPGGDGHQVSLEEPERLDPEPRNGRGKVLQVVAQGRRELPAHLLQRARLEGIDGGQSLGEALVTDLVPRPVREVIGIARGLGGAMEESGRGVAEERLRRDAPDLLEKLAHVGRLERQKLLEIDAAVEDEGFVAHRDISVRYHRTLQGPSSFQAAGEGSIG